MTPHAFNVASVAVAAACAAVAWWASVARPRRESRKAGALDVAGGALAAALVAVAAAVAVPGVGPFGAIRFLWLAGMVSAPLVAAACVVLAARKRIAMTRTAVVFASLGVATGLLGAWAVFVEPFRLQVERAEWTVPAVRAAGEPIRIGILADLQTDDACGAHESAAADALMAERPDLILVPGDLIQAPPDEYDRAAPRVRGVLSRLDAPGGVFFVHGDVDDDEDRVRALLQGTRLRAVTDEVVRTVVRGRPVTIGGVSLMIRAWPARCRASSIVDELESAPGGDDLRILLSHAPDAVFALRAGSRIDLVVAGHTHGGQVVLPFFGPPMTLSRVPRAVAAGGLHRVDTGRGAHWIHVSRGVGLERMEAPRIRLFCPPEVTVLTVR
ncbi:MAG: hypothetical protein HMLKMBBP_01864 [Planctomycetes bacterium]|nr:hypothetical protein [Planctomycetota bacterium]